MFDSLRAHHFNLMPGRGIPSYAPPVPFMMERIGKVSESNRFVRYRILATAGFDGNFRRCVGNGGRSVPVQES